MQVRKKEESKLLGKTYVELLLEGRAGKISRKEAIAAAAEAVGASADSVGIVSLDQQSGTQDVVGRFQVYSSADDMKKLHPGYLSVRLLTKEEKEKLKQDRKKAAAPAPAAEAKK